MFEQPTANESERSTAASAPGFLNCFPCKQVVALGKIAGRQLQKLGVNGTASAPSLRRRQAFRAQIAEILKT